MAPASKAGGFVKGPWVRIPPLLPQTANAFLAQLVERFRDMEEVADSSSAEGTNARVAQWQSNPLVMDRSQVRFLP
jgi:hypothetical protein